MIKVWITSNNDKFDSIEASSMTPKEILTKHGVNYTASSTVLDGCVLSVEQMNKPMSALGVAEDTECSLASVQKHDNAAE